MYSADINSEYSYRHEDYTAKEKLGDHDRRPSGQMHMEKYAREDDRDQIHKRPDRHGYSEEQSEV